MAEQRVRPKDAAESAMAVLRDQDDGDAVALVEHLLAHGWCWAPDPDHKMVWGVVRDQLAAEPPWEPDPDKAPTGRFGSGTPAAVVVWLDRPDYEVDADVLLPFLRLREAGGAGGAAML